MPTNKNASIRYQALDKCFRDSHHRYYIEDLKQKCDDALLRFNGEGGVSKRQIFEDIKFMESDAGWNIPLLRKREGKKTYYLYANPEFTINKQALTEKEAKLLETAITTLSRFHGMLNSQWVDEFVANLKWKFNLKEQDSNVIGFDQNLQLKGLAYLSLIIDAILHKKVLRLSYQSFKKGAEIHTHTVHPYYVKQYNNRWFLFGLDHATQFIYNFGIDRICSLETDTDTTYCPNEKINFDKYFQDVIGVTIPDGDTAKQHIVFRLLSPLYSYVLAKPLHPSQKIVDQERQILSIDVRPNYELDYHILSMGPDIEVLEPAEYREHIRKKLKESIHLYEPSDTDKSEE